jgi:glycosyltransferase involved in cell wall biosynthesis
MNRIKRKIFDYLHKWSLWFYFMYFFGRGYSFLLSLVPPAAPQQARPIKKAVIIYSKFHFDPEKDSPTRPYSQSSSANLARNIYKSLEGAEVIYRDHNAPVLDIPDADLVIGIVSKAFVEYSNKNPQARKVLFLVNSHPLFRLKVIAEEASANRTIIPPYEYTSPFVGLQCIKGADELVGIGNETVKETFSTFGTFDRKFTLLNSGVNHTSLVEDISKLPKEKVRILFPATNLDIRKGIFRLMKVWDKLSSTDHNYELVLLGQSGFLKKPIQSFLTRHPEVKHIEWIDSSKPDYLNLLQSAHIVLGLSLEEGQVGAVLETMATGAVPIITKESGIAIQNGRNGYLLEKFSEDAIIEILLNLDKDRKKLMDMREEVRKYIAENHNWPQFHDQIKKLLTHGN